MKTVLTIVLLLAPTVTLAEGGCHNERGQQEAATCAEGAVWDAEKGVCLPTTS